MVAALLLVGAGTAGALATDIDGDGISGLQELQDGTDPLEGDTDGDNLWDDDERSFGSDPTVADIDGDGLTDGEE